MTSAMPDQDTFALVAVACEPAPSVRRVERPHPGLPLSHG